MAHIEATVRAPAPRCTAPSFSGGPVGALSTRQVARYDTYNLDSGCFMMDSPYALPRAHALRIQNRAHPRRWRSISMHNTLRWYIGLAVLYYLYTMQYSASLIHHHPTFSLSTWLGAVEDPCQRLVFFKKLMYLVSMILGESNLLGQIKLRICAPWLSWLQRPTVKQSSYDNRKVVSSSLTGAGYFFL